MIIIFKYYKIVKTNINKTKTILFSSQAYLSNLQV